MPPCAEVRAAMCRLTCHHVERYVPQFIEVRTGMVKDEIESASQLSRRVAHEGDQRVALDALVLGPRAHHRAVVHTVHNHLLSTRGKFRTYRLASLPLGCGGLNKKRHAHRHAYAWT
eukprot:6172076-Pleurochrysis_carterae.AAC.3